MQIELMAPENRGLQFESYSTTHLVFWNGEQGNNAMQRLPRHISFSHIRANWCYQTDLEMRLGHIQKRSFLYVSSSGGPSQNLQWVAGSRGRMAA